MNFRSVIASLLIAALSGAVGASSITLNFDSLPSAQGMSLQIGSFTGATETDVFSVDGERLVFDTIGKKTIAQYRWEDSLDLDQPFSLRVAMRLDELVPETDPFASPRQVFDFLVGAKRRYYGFEYTYNGFDPADTAAFYVVSENTSEALIPDFDVFSLHEYLIEADPVSGAFTFSVDGVKIRTGYGKPLNDSSYPFDLNFFRMGGPGYACDTCEQASRLSVYGLQIAQVPEPSMSLLMLAGVGVIGTVVAVRKGRQPPL